MVSVRLIWCFWHKTGTYGKLYSHSIVVYKYTTIFYIMSTNFCGFFRLPTMCRVEKYLLLLCYSKPIIADIFN